MRIGWRTILTTILIIGAGVMGWYYGVKLTSMKLHSQVDSTVLLERIQNVHKLVLVEASFSEIYDYKDYWMYDVSPFRKKALVRVKAKALLGFDLEKAHIEIDEASQSIIIHDLPSSEILSLDHDLDYYDLQEGTFNQFSEGKLTEIGKGAKAYILDKAKQSSAMRKAEERKWDFVNEIELIAAAYGWKVLVEDDELSQIKPATSLRD